MENDDLNAVVERINAGARIPTTERSRIEHLWKAMSRIPRDRRQNTTAVGLTAVCANPDFAPKNPDEQVALTARYAMLDALVERGILSEYMEDEALRKHVFAAAATIPCDKNDLAEALAERMLRDASPDVAERTKEAAQNAGWDTDRPRIGDKFSGWIPRNC